jgi:hypothetical protein
MVPARLAIDLSGPMIRVLVGSPGDPNMKCAEAPAPAGSMAGGAVEDSGSLASLLRQLVARVEIKETRAMVVASDALASFRVLSFPKDTSEPSIDAHVRSQLPMEGSRMGMQRQELTVNGGDRTVYAVAYDRAKIQMLAATLRLAGLEPTVVELKSLCIARMAQPSACVVIDLGDPAEIFIIDGSLPRLWHTFRADPHAPGEVTASLTTAVHAALGYYRRQPEGSGFSTSAPILISTDNGFPSRIAAGLESAVGHPVAPVPAPPRVPPEIRHGSFMACLGLIMRRR